MKSIPLCFLILNYWQLIELCSAILEFQSILASIFHFISFKVGLSSKMQNTVISVQRSSNYQLNVILGTQSKYTAKKIVIQKFASMATNNFLSSTLGDCGSAPFSVYCNYAVMLHMKLILDMFSEHNSELNSNVRHQRNFMQ